MKLVLLNGSPRGKNSNSARIIDFFIRGWEEGGGGTHRTEYIRDRNSGQAEEAFLKADCVLLVFPLYADSVPGIVKDFIDALPSETGFPNKKIAFIVHSGFPEAVHSDFVARYLEKLARRWKMEHLGTVIKGGSEGIRMMNEKQALKFLAPFSELGTRLAVNGRFPDDLIARIRGAERFPRPVTFVLKILIRFGLMDRYWNENLKKHGGWADRFARPYLK
ncbi:MAG: NAD(P)H-dependent oxidoreductase [Spirochaetia bacterium]